MPAETRAFLMFTSPLRSMHVATKSTSLSFIACPAPDTAFAEKPNDRLVSKTATFGPQRSNALRIAPAQSEELGDEPYAKIAARFAPAPLADTAGDTDGQSGQLYEP